MDMHAIDQSMERIVSRSLSSAWRRKGVFLVVSLLAFSGMAIGILALRPSFEVATLLLAGQRGPEPVAGAAGAPPPVSTAALVQMALSDEVVGAALAQSDLSGSIPPALPAGRSRIDSLRETLFGSDGIRRTVPPAMADPVLPMLKRRISVRSEPNSNVIRIAFQDPDPVTAMLFANALAQAFMDRHLVLSSQAGAAEFFNRQRERFDEELRQASEALERFGSANGIYTVEQQRDMLLRRLNDLKAQMAANRVVIADKLGQRQALAEQLRRLAPVARSPYVSSLVDVLGGERPAGVPRTGDARSVTDRTSDPPLLLVRVYQESMVALFRLNADLAGAEGLREEQQLEHATLTADLARLSDLTQQFESLRRAVTQAGQNVEIYARRMVEEQISAELHAARFSALRVLERAGVATRPAFPNYPLVFAAAGVLSLLLGLVAALFWPRP
ncbi:GumC family protein [Neoroseomonas oryzicola]|uniref:Polysaccharide chain length determinant N-terminal domain-containing protein n=1 Tax=Neoroseomonas oryzicola TaxID=535904 RepID=A0A9X9WP68_9PROT|nr:hypothetical protein [Neoroseomonas oryzicola]MBR0662128.1 hypothetical protein [Neoroseomonas oryzicola]NKE20247.1 hypothetical protein [Neoroseomonas oryzicola]